MNTTPLGRFLGRNFFLAVSLFIAWLIFIVLALAVFGAFSLPLIIVIFFLMGFAAVKMESSRLSDIKNKANEVARLGLEEKVRNFVRLYGNDKGPGYFWKFRNYTIGTDRLNDLKQILHESGLKFNDQTLREVLSWFIEKWEFEATKSSLK